MNHNIFDCALNYRMTTSQNSYFLYYVNMKTSSYAFASDSLQTIHNRERRCDVEWYVLTTVEIMN